jgi:two-component system chemotaxis sensor kinase CheA
MESYLRALRQSQAMLTAEAIDGLIAGTRMLEQVTSAYRAGRALPNIAPTLAQLAGLAAECPDDLPQKPKVALQPARSNGPENGQRPQVKDGLRTWHITFTPAAELAERGINVNHIRARLQEIGELIQASPKVMPQGGITFEFTVATTADEATLAAWSEDGVSYAPLPTEPSEMKQAPVSSANLMIAPSHVVRVDLSRLDELMRLVGEMVISRGHLEDRLKDLETNLPATEWRGLQEVNSALERQLRDLREGVMRMRLVPIREIFDRMPFVVRDLARETDKKIKLELRGQETEIDKYIVERMMDPLLHLVRNAVSHGIETAAERIAQGKSPEGRIMLRASTVGEMVFIEIEDDGRGINPQQVARRARAGGIPFPDGELSNAELLEVICSPGFSTKEEADRASGRGIGMAVVKDAVLDLGGTLTLDNQIGQGAHFTIQLPLTLAIADALLVTAGGQRYAVPQAAVREVMAIQSAAIKKLENNEIIPYRGATLPLLRLTRVFSLAEKDHSSFHVFVVGTGLGTVGIAVDRILDQREIVVRAITDPLIRVPGIAGATEIGDGRAILILDPAGLIKKASELGGQKRANQQPGQPV